MAINATGLYNLIPIEISGGDALYGEYTLPEISIEGFSSSYANYYQFPLISIAGQGTVSYSEGIYKIIRPQISGIAILPSISGYGKFYLWQYIFSGRSAHWVSGSFTLPLLVISEHPLGFASGEWIFPLQSHKSVLLNILGYATVRNLPHADIYRAIVVNLKNNAISEYSAYPFNSIARIGSYYYGAFSNGIYLLQGEKDGEDDILAKIKTGPLEFGIPYLKYLREIWLTLRNGGPIAIQLATQENEEDLTHELQTSMSNTNIHEERIKTPRGLRGRYYILSIKNLASSDFILHSIRMMIEAIKMRIR